jgi:hypothetical protein
VHKVLPVGAMIPAPPPSGGRAGRGLFKSPLLCLKLKFHKSASLVVILLSRSSYSGVSVFPTAVASCCKLWSLVLSSIRVAFSFLSARSLRLMLLPF